MASDPQGRGSGRTRCWSCSTACGPRTSVTLRGQVLRLRRRHDQPRSRCRTPLPLWIGGSSDAAIERTARYGSGWLAGGAQPPAQIGRVDQRHPRQAPSSSAADRRRPLRRRLQLPLRDAGTSPSSQRQVAGLRAARRPASTRRRSWPSAAPDEVIELVQGLPRRRHLEVRPAPRRRRTTKTCWSRAASWPTRSSPRSTSWL